MQLLYILLFAWARRCAGAPIAVTDGPMADRSRPAALKNGGREHDKNKGHAHNSSAASRHRPDSRHRPEVTEVGQHTKQERGPQSHISNAAIHVTCDATSGFAELALPVADLIQLQELQLSLGDGRVEWLHRMTADIRGTTSVRFQSKQHVIKIGRNDHHLTRREACVVRKLAGGPGIPRLVGASHNDTLLVFANAGTPLGLSNMPSDYREQVEATLEHLAAHRVKHNDIWKNDPRMKNAFIVELLVGGDGHLTLIDYNTATVHGSYACAPSIRATALPPNIDRYFTPADDATTLQVRARAQARTVRTGWWC